MFKKKFRKILIEIDLFCEKVSCDRTNEIVFLIEGL